MELYIKQALEHASMNLDQESCGLVIVKNGKRRYIPCENVASDPINNFVISAEDWVNADDAGEVVCIVHSHPSSKPVPSQADQVSCELSNLQWLIVNPRTKEFNLIKPHGYEAPLYGREYCFGVLDCYTFAQDYYKRVYNIELGNHDRDDKFWEKGIDLYLNYMEVEGFYEISMQELKPGDAIIMNIGSDIGNHGAIYLGDNMIAHHMYHRVSSRDIYGGYYRKHTARFIRHRNLNQ